MFKQLYLIILGLVFILIDIYFLFWRMSNVSSEILLEDVKKNITYTKIILLLLLLLIQITIILIILYSLKKKNANNSKYVNYIKYVIKSYYEEPVEHIYNLVAPDIPYSGTFILFVEELVEKGNRKFRYKLYHNSYWFFVFFPRILVSIIFVIEIVCYKKLYIFFFALILILFSLIYNFYLKLCITFYSRNFPKFNELIQVIGEDLDEFGVYKKLIFSFKPDYDQNSKEALDATTKQWLILQRIDFHNTKINNGKDKYNSYVTLLTLILYVLGSSFRLLFLLT